MSPPPGFKFIDLPDAAQMLGITRLQLLEWVEGGRLKPLMGKGQQSVFRRNDVEKLAQELGLSLPEQVVAPIPTPEAAPDGDSATEGSGGARSVPSTARAKRRDPVKLIGTRLSMDSRWAEITDEDIATWLDAIEAVQFDRVRRVIAITTERLNHLIAAIDADPRA